MVIFPVGDTVCMTADENMVALRNIDAFIACVLIADAVSLADLTGDVDDFANTCDVVSR
jgi:hypothetical protein